jgi:hypothetical protein
VAKKRRKKGQGWYNFPVEHGLASRGIKTVIPGRHGNEPNVGYKRVGLGNPLRKEYLLLVDDDIEKLVDAVARCELREIEAKQQAREPRKVTFPPARVTTVAPIPVSEERIARIQAHAEMEKLRLKALAEAQRIEQADARARQGERLKAAANKAAQEFLHEQEIKERKAKRQRERLRGEEKEKISKAPADEQLKPEKVRPRRPKKMTLREVELEAQEIENTFPGQVDMEVLPKNGGYSIEYDIPDEVDNRQALQINRRIDSLLRRAKKEPIFEIRKSQIKKGVVKKEAIKLKGAERKRQAKLKNIVAHGKKAMERKGRKKTMEPKEVKTSAQLESEYRAVMERGRKKEVERKKAKKVKR